MKKTFSTLCFGLFFLHFTFSQVTISGTIATEIGDPLVGVSVYAGGTSSDTTTTDNNGFYSFTFPSGGAYTITPFKNNDPLNGVSTFDKVLIEQHILGLVPLDSPYKMIAADVNKSNTITTQDIVELEDLITGVITNFTNNTSWRFIDSSNINLNNVTADITNLDFIAIKVGDVNYSAFTQNPAPVGLLTGKVYFDENSNCQEDNGELTLGGWHVIATDSVGVEYYGTTNDLGEYSILAHVGTYSVKAIRPNVLWETCVDSIPNVIVTTLTEGIADFGAVAVDECADMNVELSTIFLRRCFGNTYVVNYCNLGTADAEGSSVEVTLDTFFTNISSSIPWTAVNGNTYTFEIGNVGIGECGSFEIDFTLDCDATLGQTHCSSAHIYPEPPCTPVDPLWNGADLEIIGECDGTNVKFTAINHGDDMTEPVNYIVIEDIMIQMTGELMLASGQSQVINEMANGSTWRMTASEAGYHPFETIASAVVEGCGENGDGVFSIGFVNQFPLSDEEPFEDEDCQENIGSYDPNDKIGYPIGYDAAHFIEKNQDLSYRIRFQNTGSDTAFNIVVLDTLPNTLDPTTIRVQGSSHPMEFELMGSGVAKFRFPNIMLPDSNVNEALSHGFVKFNISQKPNLPLGTTIENEAAIYFDFNAPIITNRTLHTIGERLLEVSSTEVFLPNVAVNVFPNPFDAEATFELDGIDVKNGELHLFNVQGGLVKMQRFVGSSFNFDGTVLPEGLYFFLVTDGGVRIASGKILVK